MKLEKLIEIFETVTKDMDYTLNFIAGHENDFNEESQHFAPPLVYLFTDKLERQSTSNNLVKMNTWNVNIAFIQTYEYDNKREQQTEIQERADKFVQELEWKLLDYQIDWGEITLGNRRTSPMFYDYANRLAGQAITIPIIAPENVYGC